MSTETCQGNKAEISIEELIIEDGENKIYGKLYAPKGESEHPAIIMSHGYNGTNADFISECRYYAENGYVAYAYDFCGGSVASKSNGKSTDMTVFTEKENLLAVYNHIQGLENVDLQQIFLFGGSMGGFVTALATEELQDKVKGMILYFPAFNIPDNWRRIYATEDAIPETNDFWGLTLGRVFFSSILDFYTFDNIGTYAKNVLIIYGDEDNIVPLDHMLKAQQTYKSAQLIILPNEGHGFSLAGAKEAKEQVLRFMNQHRAGNVVV